MSKHEKRDRRRRRYGRAPLSLSEHIRARANATFIDHAFFRLAYLNLHKMGDKAFRSAQPWPHHLRRLARRGLRTVVNLRGPSEFGSYALELDAVEELGLDYRELKLSSREPPSLQAIEAVARLFDEIAYPALFHCKSGADRTGMLGALYMLLHEQAGLEAARDQLHWRYGHFKQAKTGVLDAVLDAYEAARDAEGGALDFLDWARGDYDPKAIKAAFRENNLYGALVDKVLRRE